MTEGAETGIWTGIGGLLGGIGVAVTAWWKLRKDRRDDAVDSVSARAGINMLEVAQKEREQAEKELADERKERLASERALTGAVADQRDTKRKLDGAIKDIAMLRRKLKRAGVPDSDYVPLLETELGPLDDGKH